MLSADFSSGSDSFFLCQLRILSPILGYSPFFFDLDFFGLEAFFTDSTAEDTCDSWVSRKLVGTR